jgi:hypothetical protein
MRKKITSGSPKLTLVQGGDGKGESGSASTIYGPVRAGLTTSQRTNKVAQLSESLKDLERQTADLESRFYEVCVTLNLVMGVLVERKLFGISTDTIDKEEESK